MRFKDKVKQITAGIALTATSLVGYNAAKNNNNINTEKLNEPISANQTVDTQPSHTIQAEEAAYNTSLENPSITINTDTSQALAQEEIDSSALGREFLAQLQGHLSHHFDYEDIMALDSDQRAEIIHKVAQDYRACEKSIEATGKVDPEIVGENNFCGKYFGDDLKHLNNKNDLLTMVQFITTEEYAQQMDGIPQNTQEQKILDHLGEDFTKFYQANEELRKVELPKQIADLHNYLKEHVGDLSHLQQSLESKNEADLEVYNETQQKLETITEEYIQAQVQELENQGLSDTEFLAKRTQVESAAQFIGNVDNYIKNYGTNFEESLSIDRSQGYDDTMKFVRSIRAAGELSGVNDDIKMSLDTRTDELTIEDYELEL